MRAAGSVLSVLLVVPAGCGTDPPAEGGQASSGPGTGAVSVEFDEELGLALRDLSARRDSARLAELTPFEWDTVHVFGEGATRHEVHEAVGSPVLTSERYYDAGNLLVFSLEGSVVRAVSVVPDLLVTRSADGFGSGTELVPHGSATPALLLLREP